MKYPQAISAPTLHDAVEYVHVDPEYQLVNDWLVDIDGRIKHFIFENEALVAKRCSQTKAQKERDAALMASERIGGVDVNGRSIQIAVPEIMTLSSDTEKCYLISRFAGTDLNQVYYSGQSNPLSGADWDAIVSLAASAGISYRDFLPRNTIVTPDEITLIDWENAKFSHTATLPNISTWITYAVSWSYLFGLKHITDLRSKMGISSEQDQILSGYQKTLTGYLGCEKSAKLSELVCQTVIRAEASRNTSRLPYKLDDAFHVVSEMVPAEIEVLMDMLFAAQEDKAHMAAARLLGSACISLHSACISGKSSEQALQNFKERCAKLAWFLMDYDAEITNTEVRDIKWIDQVVVVPKETGSIAQGIRKWIARQYPDSEQNRELIDTAATSLRGLVLARI